jgi:hypothetical protein
MRVESAPRAGQGSSSQVRGNVGAEHRTDETPRESRCLPKGAILDAVVRALLSAIGRAHRESSARAGVSADPAVESGELGIS